MVSIEIHPKKFPRALWPVREDRTGFGLSMIIASQNKPNLGTQQNSKCNYKLEALLESWDSTKFRNPSPSVTLDTPATTVLSKVLATLKKLQLVVKVDVVAIEFWATVASSPKQTERGTSKAYSKHQIANNNDETSKTNATVDQIVWNLKGPKLHTLL